MSDPELQRIVSEDPTLAEQFGEHNPHTDFCEYPGCDRAGICSVHAQWTVVDFISYYACKNHARDILLTLWSQRVDGNLPLDVWIQWWDLS